MSYTQTECESFEHMMTDEIMRTVFRYTNRKCREIRRTLSTQNYHEFSMEEFKAALAVILRAGSDRDNFTELQKLMGRRRQQTFLQESYVFESLQMLPKMCKV